MQALNLFSQYRSLVGMVAEIFSRPAFWEDVNDMVSLRCGEDVIWWAVETLGRRWQDNMEWQMLLCNHDLSNDEDNDDGNGNSKGSGQEKGANTGKVKQCVRPDERGEDDDHPSKDDYPGVLEWLRMCTRAELAIVLAMFPFSDGF